MLVFPFIIYSFSLIASPVTKVKPELELASDEDGPLLSSTDSLFSSSLFLLFSLFSSFRGVFSLFFSSLISSFAGSSFLSSLAGVSLFSSFTGVSFTDSSFLSSLAEVSLFSSFAGASFSVINPLVIRSSNSTLGEFVLSPIIPYPSPSPAICEFST